MNINDKVTVVLTEYGQVILNSHREKLESEMRLKFNLTLKCDENGKYTTELWHLMFLFGQYMTMSSSQVFVNNQIHIK